MYPSLFKRSLVSGEASFPKPFQEVYRGIVDTDILGYETPTSLRKRPKNLEALRRFWGRVPAGWAVPEMCSSGWPTYLYYTYLKKIGQVPLAKELWRLLGTIRHRWTKFRKQFPKFDELEYMDDFFRKSLKSIHSIAFQKTFTVGPAYMLLCHLHALTGKAPYTNEQIEDDIDKWVSGSIEGKEKDLHKETVNRVLDEVFEQWNYKTEKPLTFRQFCNDFYRWGTSGGASSSMIDGSKYRTKWAWAYSKSVDETGDLKSGVDLYDESLKERDVARVALKEEAQKTREIITTSMSSYLRQCYLMYRWGKPTLPSPISRGSWVGEFETENPKWYGCLDGEGFDQCIPAWFVENVLERLGSLDAETASVARKEIWSLQKLKIEWRKKKWPWKGGILSGWRLTSVLGTLVSYCAAQYIIQSCRLSGGINIGCLGDDLVLYSNTVAIRFDDMLELYNRFGLRANPQKTVSGNIGEFLRKVLSPGGSWGYPALALRSLCYANPWISSYEFEHEVELSTSWLTFISRLMPHSTHEREEPLKWLMDCMINLTQQFGPGPWFDWISTPVSAGGGGSIETSDMSRWTYLTHKPLNSEYDTGVKAIASILGIVKSKLVFERHPSFSPININVALADERMLVSSDKYNQPMGFKYGVDSTRTMFDFLAGRINRSELNSALRFPLARGLRGAKPEEIIRTIVSAGREESGYTSISHSKEVASQTTKLSRALTRGIFISKRFLNPYILKPAATLYYHQVLGNQRLPYGTW